MVPRIEQLSEMRSGPSVLLQQPVALLADTVITDQIAEVGGGDLADKTVDKGAALRWPLVSQLPVLRTQHHHRHHPDQVRQPVKRAVIDKDLLPLPSRIAASNLALRSDLPSEVALEHEVALATGNDVAITPRDGAAGHAEVVNGVNQTGFTDPIRACDNIDVRGKICSGLPVISEMLYGEPGYMHSAWSGNSTAGSRPGAGCKFSAVPSIFTLPRWWSVVAPSFIKVPSMATPQRGSVADQIPKTSLPG